MSDGSQTGQAAPDTAALEALIQSVGKRKAPPVHDWNPAFSGDMDMRIGRDGSWFHEGVKIERVELVRLFASILKREGDAFYLVSPVEKFRIQVDNTPFVAVDFVVKDEFLHFETNVGDWVVASDANPIRVIEDPVTGEPAPYVEVRDQLDALIDRKSFYRLADMGVVEENRVVVRVGPSRFDIGPAA